MRKEIIGQQFDAERSLYHLQKADVIDCVFAGPADGESVLKEARDKAAAIIEKAQQEADEIVAQAKKENPDYDPIVEAILKEYSVDQ